MIMELGRLVKDVEVKKLDFNGESKVVLNNVLAIKNGKDDNSVVFVDITAWGNTAVAMEKYLKKGDELVINGELRSKKIKVGDKEIDRIYILVQTLKFTYGNKREVKEKTAEDDELPFK